MIAENRKIRYGVVYKDENRQFIADDLGNPVVFAFKAVSEDDVGKKYWCKVNPMTNKVISYVAYRLMMVNGKSVFMLA